MNGQTILPFVQQSIVPSQVNTKRKGKEKARAEDYVVLDSSSEDEIEDADSAPKIKGTRSKSSRTGGLLPSKSVPEEEEEDELQLHSLPVPNRSGIQKGIVKERLAGFEKRIPHQLESQDGDTSFDSILVRPLLSLFYSQTDARASIAKDYRQTEQAESNDQHPLRLLSTRSQSSHARFQRWLYSLLDAQYD